MTVPNSEITILDGGMGMAAAQVDGISAKIGTSSIGSAGTVYPFAGTDTQAVRTTLGVGPLVDATIKHLLRSGGKTVYAYKGTATTAGASTGVTASGGGPTVTLTGAPYDTSSSIVVIVLGGAIGTSTFKYTLDGGDTYSDVFVTAATYLLPSGVTVNFAAGTYVATETYSWTDTAPIMTTTNVGDAMDALTLSAYEFEFVHILGQAASAADTATMMATVQTKVESAHTAHKYIWAIMEAAAVAASTHVTAAAAVNAKWTMVCAGFCELLNDRNQAIDKRSSGRVFAPRIARNDIAVHVLRSANDAFGPDSFPDVITLVPSGAAASTGYHDEDKTPSLDAARFATLRTIVGAPGVYPTNGKMMALVSSDYTDNQHVRIVLKAARVLYVWSLGQLARRLRKNPDTGFIASKFADGIEENALDTLKAQIGASVDGLSVKVNRADLITTDPTLRIKVRLVGPAYAIETEVELGLAAALAA